MPYYTFTSSTDLTTKGRKLKAWDIANSGVAGTVNIRNGSVTGDIVVPVRLPVGSTTPVSAGEDYSHPFRTFPNGIYVEVLAGTIAGSVEIV